MSDTISKTTGKKTKDPRTSYEQLSDYFNDVQQKILSMWTPRELGRHFFGDRKGLLDDSSSISDNIMSVGINYKPADFKLTDIYITQNIECDELVIRIAFERNNTPQTMILHAEKYGEAKRYTVISAVEDVLAAVQNEVYEMCPDKEDDD